MVPVREPLVVTTGFGPEPVGVRGPGATTSFAAEPAGTHGAVGAHGALTGAAHPPVVAVAPMPGVAPVADHAAALASPVTYAA